MDKNEFLEKLAKALAGQVPASVVEENINYYSSYISGEVQKGTPLQQVLDDLGDPRLIAKSIIDANGGGNDMAGFYEDSGRSGHRSQREPEKEDPFGQQSERFRSFHFSGFWGLLLLIVIVCCIFMVVGTVIGGIFLLIRPILLPLLIILLVYHMFRGPRRF
ncbi:MAG: DUF1700 domain-containing protein [Lachnospiraceae bacterium]|nr:DUF1700 domain-containing protein [Lachnospiraceae bacterium]